MSGCGCDTVCDTPPPNPAYRRALWIALVLNALMFGVELVASFAAQSVSLLADAVDFLRANGKTAVCPLLFPLCGGAIFCSRLVWFRALNF